MVAILPWATMFYIDIGCNDHKKALLLLGVISK